MTGDQIVCLKVQHFFLMLEGRYLQNSGHFSCDQRRNGTGRAEAKG